MPDKAIASYKQAIALSPAITYRIRAGCALLPSRQVPEAAEQFGNTIARAPGNFQVYINLGAVLSDQGRDAEAEEALLASLHIRETAGAFNSLAPSARIKGDAEAGVPPARHRPKPQGQIPSAQPAIRRAVWAAPPTRMPPITAAWTWHSTN
jgi:tetratricopeptide (TPR) repeat protein